MLRQQTPSYVYRHSDLSFCPRNLSDSAKCPRIRGAFIYVIALRIPVFIVLLLALLGRQF